MLNPQRPDCTTSIMRLLLARRAITIWHLLPSPAASHSPPLPSRAVPTLAKRALASPCIHMPSLTHAWFAVPMVVFAGIAGSAGQRRRRSGPHWMRWCPGCAPCWTKKRRPARQPPAASTCRAAVVALAWPLACQLGSRQQLLKLSTSSRRTEHRRAFSSSPAGAQGCRARLSGRAGFAGHAQHYRMLKQGQRIYHLSITKCRETDQASLREEMRRHLSEKKAC